MGLVEKYINMILYNVTIGIDLDIENEWLEWMVTKHIPKVMATGMFQEYKIFKVLSQEDQGSSSYSIQYFSDTIEKVVKYLDEFAPSLVEEHRQKYINRHVAFRTMLEQIEL